MVLSGFCPGCPLQCHTYPAEPGTASALRQLLAAAEAAPQKRWISTGGGECWVHREQTLVHHPRAPGSLLPRLCILPSVFNKQQHRIKVFYKPPQPTSMMWVLAPLRRWREAVLLMSLPATSVRSRELLPVGKQKNATVKLAASKKKKLCAMGPVSLLLPISSVPG